MPWVTAAGSVTSKCLGHTVGTVSNIPNLHLHGPSLYLGDALGEDEGDAVVGAAGHLGELPAEELQAALQLLVAALDGQRLQAALVTRQETLPGEAEARGVAFK